MTAQHATVEARADEILVSKGLTPSVAAPAAAAAVSAEPAAPVEPAPPSVPAWDGTDVPQMQEDDTPALDPMIIGADGRLPSRWRPWPRRPPPPPRRSPSRWRPWPKRPPSRWRPWPKRPPAGPPALAEDRAGRGRGDRRSPKTAEVESASHADALEDRQDGKWTHGRSHGRRRGQRDRCAREPRGRARLGGHHRGRVRGSEAELLGRL